MQKIRNLLLYVVVEHTWGPVGWENDPVSIGWRGDIRGDEVWPSCRITGLLIGGHQGQLLQYGEEQWQAAHTVDHILPQTQQQHIFKYVHPCNSSCNIPLSTEPLHDSMSWMLLPPWYPSWRLYSQSGVHAACLETDLDRLVSYTPVQERTMFSW